MTAKVEPYLKYHAHPCDFPGRPCHGSCSFHHGCRINAGFWLHSAILEVLDSSSLCFFGLIGGVAARGGHGADLGQGKVVAFVGRSSCSLGASSLKASLLSAPCVGLEIHELTDSGEPKRMLLYFQSRIISQHLWICQTALVCVLDSVQTDVFPLVAPYASRSRRSVSTFLPS